MLKASEQIKRDFVTDGSYKEMYIETEGGQVSNYTEINFYTGEYNSTPYTGTVNNTSGGGVDTLEFLFGQDTVDTRFLYYGEYAYISLRLKLTSVTTMARNLHIVVSAETSGQLGQFNYPLDLTDSDIVDQITGDGIRLFIRVNAASVNSINYVFMSFEGNFVADYAVDQCQVSLSDYAYNATELYDEDAVPYLGESIARQGIDIADYIVKADIPYINPLTSEDLELEAYSQNESLSSGNNLKFGACEASTCEFTVRDRNDNWKDRYIRPYTCLYDERFTITWVNFYAGSSMYTPSDVQTHDFSNMTSQLSWQMGTREPRTFGQLTDGFKQHKGDKKVICVSYKAKLEVTECSEDHLEKIILGVNFYNGETLVGWWFPTSLVGEEHDTVFDVSEISADFVQVRVYIPQDSSVNPYNQNYYDDIQRFVQVVYRFQHNDGTNYSSGTIKYKMQVKEIQINLVDHYYDDVPEWDIEDCIEYNGISLDEYKMNKTGKIPLGRFCVKEIKKIHKPGIQKLILTAYDDLIKLNQNATNWYTRYMWAFNTDDYTQRYGFEVARQMYSTYHNIMWGLGIERRRTFYNETQIQYHDGTDIGDLTNGEKIFRHVIDSSSQIQIKFAAFIVTGADHMKPYVVDMGTLDDAYVRANMDRYAIYVDRAFRGCTNANIIIEPLDGDNTQLFCVDNGDLFMIPPNCTSFKVWYPYKMINDTYITTGFDYVSSVEISRSEHVIDLANKHIRLMYYNWGTREIFAVNSSITARDVVRSLLEITGCFLHIDRYGKPAFKYCTKSGLYPANDLYPSDTLYPRGLDGETINLDTYISAETEDYQVQDIGRIQIIRQQVSNEAKSICEWEYEGDSTRKNTYLIDDNIFYSNESMEYEYGSMPEVAEMLENMYNRISSMGYTPGKLEMTGMPWLEVGDRIGVLTDTGGIESFIFRRTYKGIIAPKDTYTSQGDEYIEAVKDYGYREME